MDNLIIAFTAFGASLLTFYSGFGLGTLLTPVFMLFFPVDVAIALTGVVHFFNNLFKITLVGHKADSTIVKNFGIPAILAAFLGAALLLKLSTPSPLFYYEFMGQTFEVYLLKLIVALLLIVFALIDLIPYFKNLQFGRDKMAIGGFLSGFFGGLSGNQGALRSAFLIKAGLTKEAFIGTAVVISTLVDFTRLGVYATQIKNIDFSQNRNIVLLATLSAIFGAFIGHKLLKKVTIGFIQSTVAILLIVLSIALGFGWL